MSKCGYYLKAGSQALFFALFLLILLIGPVFHNHTWQLVEPTHCPAFFLEQVFSSMVMFFLLVMLFNLPGQSSFFEFDQLSPKRFILSLSQTNRPPPVTN
jgi:hypothetical protein